MASRRIFYKQRKSKRPTPSGRPFPQLHCTEWGSPHRGRTAPFGHTKVKGYQRSPHLYTSRVPFPMVNQNQKTSMARWQPLSQVPFTSNLSHFQRNIIFYSDYIVLSRLAVQNPGRCSSHANNVFTKKWMNQRLTSQSTFPYALLWNHDFNKIKGELNLVTHL